MSLKIEDLKKKTHHNHVIVHLKNKDFDPYFSVFTADSSELKQHKFPIYSGVSVTLSHAQES